MIFVSLLMVVAVWLIYEKNTPKVSLQQDIAQGKNDKAPFSAQAIKQMPLIESMASVVSYPLEEMPETADLVVTAEAVQPFEEREHIANYNETPEDHLQPKTFTGGFTRTKVVIKDIIKPNERDALTIGDELTIYEPTTIFEEADGHYVKYAAENYVALRQDTTYLLFLVKPDPTSPDYGLQNFNEGRFALDDDKELVNQAEALGMAETMKGSIIEDDITVMDEALQKHQQYRAYLLRHYQTQLAK